MPSLGRRPNLLVIMTDQQSSWTLSCYGARETATPNVDRIAREGVRLVNYFANSASCTPSRGCFFSGLYPHRHGAFFNDLPLRRDVSTMAHLLQDRGYDTTYIGKWHLDGDWATASAALVSSGSSPERLGIPPEERVARDRAAWVDPTRSMGFDDCRWMFNCSHAKSVLERAGGGAQLVDSRIGDDKSYTTDWLTDRAIEALARRRARPAPARSVLGASPVRLPVPPFRHGGAVHVSSTGTSGLADYRFRQSLASPPVGRRKRGESPESEGSVPGGGRLHRRERGKTDGRSGARRLAGRDGVPGSVHRPLSQPDPGRQDRGGVRDNR